MIRQPDDPGVRRHAYGPRIERELKIPEPHFSDRIGWAALIVLAVFLYAALAVIAALILVPVKAGAQEDNCQGGAISKSCCCTNNCCRSIPATDIRAIGPDEYLIIASGQTIRRTGWSPDGSIIRCACDVIDGKWTVHPKAHTRCLYIPMPNA